MSKLIDIVELAFILGYSTKTIRRMIKSNKIPYYKNGTYRFDLEAVKESLSFKQLQVPIVIHSPVKPRKKPYLSLEEKLNKTLENIDKVGPKC